MRERDAVRWVADAGWAHLPGALAMLHAEMRPGDRVEVGFSLKAPLDEATANLLLEGAGFRPHASRLRGASFTATVRRVRTLADLIGPDLRLLICGLNPSVYSADAGIPFARPGNRFWPAARMAGLVDVERDPRLAFERQIGFTDIVKRATPSASELGPAEYRAGLARVERVVRVYAPRAVCFVGLEGWRRAVDRKAEAGWAASGLGGRPAYLMPSTSGRNAHSPLAELAAHLRRAADGNPLPKLRK